MTEIMGDKKRENNFFPKGITIEDLRQIRNYFAANDASIFEQCCFLKLDNIIKHINKQLLTESEKAQ